MTGLLNERELAGLYGNAEIKRYIESAYERGSLSHAYIFEGVRGSGRHTLAREIIKLLAPDFSRKIDDNLTPDVIYIHCEENKKTIGVDIIRDVKEQAILTPNEMDFVAFIIEDAELMTPAAQNALLKLLEEPPCDTYIFMLCESVNGLLTTIISRAPILRLETFDDEQLARYLKENNKKACDLIKKDPEAFEYAVRSASGSIGEAIRLLDARARNSSESISSNSAVKKALELLISTNKAEFTVLITTLTAKREEFTIFLEYFEAALRDLICAKSRAFDVKPMFFGSCAEAEETANKYSIEKIYKLIAAVTEMHEAVSFNVNIRLAEAVFADRVKRAVSDL